jgi:hypothetical protein
MFAPLASRVRKSGTGAPASSFWWCAPTATGTAIKRSKSRSILTFSTRQACCSFTGGLPSKSVAAVCPKERETVRALDAEERVIGELARKSGEDDGDSSLAIVL